MEQAGCYEDYPVSQSLPNLILTSCACLDIDKSGQNDSGRVEGG